MTWVVVLIENGEVDVENFLRFWTDHNRFIIELTFGFIFIFILLLIYRQFFNQNGENFSQSGEHSLNIDTTEIEKKLQKIMEGQLSLKGQIGNVDGALGVSNGDSLYGSNASQEELGSLKKEIDDLKEQILKKNQTIENLNKVSAMVVEKAADSVESNNSKIDLDRKQELEGKVKELEGRLQEYEIISEDIADLSFYKEENARLQKELNELKGGADVPEPAKPEPKANSVDDDLMKEFAAAIQDQKKPSVTNVLEKSSSDAKVPAAQSAAPQSSAPQSSAPGTPGAQSETSSIDDDLMKEFAAAIEDQKKSPMNKEKETKDVENEKLKESQQLMGDFENFLKKN